MRWPSHANALGLGVAFDERDEFLHFLFRHLVLLGDAPDRPAEEEMFDANLSEFGHQLAAASRVEQELYGRPVESKPNRFPPPADDTRSDAEQAADIADGFLAGGNEFDQKSLIRREDGELVFEQFEVLGNELAGFPGNVRIF